MTPVLFSVWFHGDSNQYPRLARVLEHSARKHCPNWDVIVREIKTTPLDLRSPRGSFAGDNSWKLEQWVRALDLLEDGTPLLLVDSDTFVNAPLDSLWDLEFDVAYTVRPAGGRFPLNGGVIALRVNDRSREFMRSWLEVDRRFLRDLAEQEPWRKRYGGQNQSSLGYVLEVLAGAFYQPTRILPIECLEWNCEDLCWASYDPARTKIVHVKSALRMELFNIGASRFDLKPLAAVWKRLEAELDTDPNPAYTGN